MVYLLCLSIYQNIGHPLVVVMNHLASTNLISSVWVLECSDVARLIACVKISIVCGTSSGVWIFSEIDKCSPDSRCICLTSPRGCMSPSPSSTESPSGGRPPGYAPCTPCSETTHMWCAASKYGNIIIKCSRTTSASRIKIQGGKIKG